MDEFELTDKIITVEELELLHEAFGIPKSKHGVLLDQVKPIMEAYNNKHITNDKVLKILRRFDKDGDGVLSEEDLEVLHHQFSLQESGARYAGYLAGLARIMQSPAFRYLAFTSDVGEAIRPVAHTAVVTGTYAIAFGYCFVDVAWEAYKLKQRGYVSEENKPMTMTQCVVERAAFQAVASIAVPMLFIHTAVDKSKLLFKRIRKFQRFGPSVVGLCAIPLLPLCFDEPVEHALHWGFKNYGPWAEKGVRKETEKTHKKD